MDAMRVCTNGQFPLEESGTTKLLTKEDFFEERKQQGFLSCILPLLT